MRHFSTLAALSVIAIGSVSAQSFTWVPTGGSTYNWNTNANWSPNTGFPDAAGTVANLNNDITVSQTIQLQQLITTGTLNLGDANGSNTFTISMGTTGTLVFDSGVTGQPASINLTSTGTMTNTISAPVLLNSDLNVNLGGTDAANAQRLALSGAFDATGRNVTLAGGIYGFSTVSFSNLIGDADTVVTNNSNGAMTVSVPQTNFFGTFILNGRAGGSNTTTLSTGPSGSVLNAKEIVINGYLTGGATQMGGAMQTGDGQAPTVNPGQRLTQNTITLNGGYLNAGGQKLDVSVVDRVVKDTVNVLNVNSGYSLLTVSGAANNGEPLSSQRVLDVTTMNRGAGATFFVRSNTIATSSVTNGTIFRIGNAASFLVGGGGAEGTTQMSIVPWMVVANGNANASSSNSFATSLSGTNGIRALYDSEYATSLTAGATHNVSIGSAALANPTTTVTINSFRYTSGSVSNIGLGKTINVASGAVTFNNGGGGIGIAGSGSAGTLAFGSAEGVIWANGSNNNFIGSTIDGIGGLTKAGTGTLTLTGQNTFSGRTYVSAGTMIVGDGTNDSSLGTSDDVAVASGATLFLMNDSAISDTAILTLENIGLFNGILNLAAGLDETVGGLYFGDMLMGAGTYGAVGSGADFQSNQWFAGSGILTVVPEPSTVMLMGLGAMVALFGRRRKLV